MCVAHPQGVPHSVPVGSLDALLETLDLRRPAVAAHSRRVAAYARQLGAFTGVPAEDLAALVQAALIHEAGALVGGGDDVTVELPGIDTWCGLSEDVADILWYAARPYASYPHAPLAARLLAVAHAFDELRRPREYQVPLSVESARMALAREAGRRFCPTAVIALMGCALETSDASEGRGVELALPDRPARIANPDDLRPLRGYRRVTTS